MRKGVKLRTFFVHTSWILQQEKTIIIYPIITQQPQQPSFHSLEWFSYQAACSYWSWNSAGIPCQDGNSPDTQKSAFHPRCCIPHHAGFSATQYNDNPQVPTVSSTISTIDFGNTTHHLLRTVNKSTSIWSKLCFICLTCSSISPNLSTINKSQYFMYAIVIFTAIFFRDSNTCDKIVLTK